MLMQKLPDSINIEKVKCIGDACSNCLNFHKFKMEIGFRETVLSTLNPVANEEFHVE